MEKLKTYLKVRKGEEYFSQENINPQIKNLYRSIDWIKDDTYNHIDRFQSYLIRFEKDNKNLNVILEFLNFKRIEEDLKLPSINRICDVWFKFFSLPVWRDMTKENIREIFQRVKISFNPKNDKPLSYDTKITEWRVIKEILRYYEVEYDLSRFKMKGHHHYLKHDDLYTNEEFKAVMVELGIHQYGKGFEYQTFYLMECESGGRYSEVHNITSKDLKPFENGLIAEVWEKSVDERPLYFSHSARYVQELIKTGWTHWSFEYHAFYRQLKRIERKLKLNGKLRDNISVKNHLLRHNHFSYLYGQSELSNGELKIIEGWSANSKMFQVYGHLDDMKILAKSAKIIESNPMIKDF